MVLWAFDLHSCSLLSRKSVNLPLDDSAVNEYTISVYCIVIFREMHVEGFGNPHTVANRMFYRLTICPCEWMDHVASFVNCSTNYITVAVSAKRLLAIAHPSTFERLQLSTRTTKFVIVSMFIAASLYYRPQTIASANSRLLLACFPQNSDLTSLPKISAYQLKNFEPRSG